MFKKLFVALLLLSLTACAKNIGYDAKRDAFAQFEQAVTQAHDQDKLILLIAGGDWCRWCFALADFLSLNQDIEQSLKDTFVVTKIYVGDEKENTEFFSQLPKATGYPHFWVISPQRTILLSQDTALLELDEGYDSDKFMAFIDLWRQYDISQAAALVEGMVAS